MKRKKTSLQTGPAKRLRLDQEPIDLIKSKSIREQAEPYRLATAKFLVEALTSTWSLGSNRQIHENHVQSLCRIFEEQGLQREPAENHLLIACTRAEVQRMMAHLEQTGHDRTEWLGSTTSWPSFEDWTSVNESKAEIMAGQHRVEALKLYLRRISSNHSGADTFEKSQSWWICDIYDKDRLPAHLSVKLRANRQGSILPDSHGQVWMELATLAAADTSLFQGANAQVQDEMLRALGLSGRVPFPIRRLMTLWKNRSWQPMVTRWCSTDIGRETFNVSLWEEMARHRIDDFWFDTFGTALKSISRLGGKATASIKLDDWNVLSRVLPSRSAKDVRGIFYPDAPDDVLIDLKVEGQLYRRPKFLVAYDDFNYYEMYQTVLDNPDLQFPDIQALFRIGRQLGKVMSQILIHVGQWLNLRRMQVSERDNNKPQLWRDFIPAFQEEYGDRSEEMALHLQREIFNVVHKRIDEFTDSTTSAYLSQLPEDQGDAYLERFVLPIWKDLLITVRQVAGSRFQRSLVKFNTESPTSLPSQPDSSLSHFLRDAISRAPGIRLNPALCSSQALEILITRIAPIVTDWAAQHGGSAGVSKTQNHNATSLGRSSQIVEVVPFQHGELGVSSTKSNLSTSMLPHGSILLGHASVASTSTRGEKHGMNSVTKECSETLQMDVIKVCGLGQKEDYEISRSSIRKILNT